LDVGPAVVRAGLALVDLLESLPADIVHVEAPGATLEREREGVSEAQSPDRAILSSRLLDERIVRRNRAIARDAEELSLEGVEGLRGLAGRLFADRDEEAPVGA